ncbi:MAG: hypothetical protein HYZ75_19550 [Elusimicrobia bacterium]|nr:hypothetical protein [Elusimicrobiota bacterium]
MTQGETLRGLLERVGAARRAGSEPLVLLDLDDTLLATAQRHVRIMAEFAAARPEAAAIAQIPPAAVRYLVTETAEAAGLTHPELLSELKEFWCKRFFANEYLAHDDQVPGAAAYCKLIVKGGGVPVYFTGRDEGMREGTLKSLARHGFPMPDEGGEARLVLKDKFDTPDLEYKRRGLDILAGRGSVEGGFENEPAHINLFDDRFPAATNIFVDTKHSGKPVKPKAHLPVVRDFLI